VSGHQANVPRPLSAFTDSFKSRLTLKAKLRLKNFNVGVEAEAANKLFLVSLENKIWHKVES